jgi:hypothetical protein
MTTRPGATAGGLDTPDEPGTCALVRHPGWPALGRAMTVASVQPSTLPSEKCHSSGTRDAAEAGLAALSCRWSAVERLPHREEVRGSSNGCIHAWAICGPQALRRVSNIAMV